MLVHFTNNYQYKETAIHFRRELYAASSRGRCGNAFSVTGVWSMNGSIQCTWHWQVEAYDVSKWASAGIKGRLWNMSSSFFVFRGLCFWSVSIMKLFRLLFRHQMTHMTYALGGEHARSVLEGMECVHCEPFSLGKAPLSFVPFLKRIGAIICPPRLGSSRCWRSEKTEFAAIADGACERVWESLRIFYLALDSG